MIANIDESRGIITWCVGRGLVVRNKYYYQFQRKRKGEIKKLVLEKNVNLALISVLDLLLMRSLQVETRKTIESSDELRTNLKWQTRKHVKRL